MKKVKISESDLKRLINESIGKNLIEQSFTVEPNVPETNRETGIRNIFGRYSEEIPNDILRYMRKNPKLIIQRLMDLYGEKFFEYVGDVASDLRAEQGPLDESIGIENLSDFEDEEEEESYEDMQMREYIKTVARPINKGESFDDSMMTEIDFYRGKMRPFRGSIYVDGVVPETDDKEIDRKVAKEMLSFLAKRLKYENYVGGVGFKQRGNLSQPYDNMDF